MSVAESISLAPIGSSALPGVPAPLLFSLAVRLDNSQMLASILEGARVADDIRNGLQPSAPGYRVAFDRRSGNAIFYAHDGRTVVFHFVTQLSRQDAVEIHRAWRAGADESSVALERCYSRQTGRSVSAIDLTSPFGYANAEALAGAYSMFR